MGNTKSYEFRETDEPSDGSTPDADGVSYGAEAQAEAQAEATGPGGEHLVVLVHGMDGSPRDLRHLAKLLVRRFGAANTGRVVVFCPRTNAPLAGASRTHQGGARRVTTVAARAALLDSGPLARRPHRPLLHRGAVRAGIL
eukprot:TRINITY_DN21055_c0_g1_i1.p3 TRINITY_DN21055_c0_g1~~TRINITY_DN21055_c0_g1_i1.p3  ORF type:complete len:141 (+),score=23.35 TRINITY_DN21055_c0_g1_i1:212-634(+)